MKNLTFGKSKGVGVLRFKKKLKTPYGMVVQLHSESFDNVAQLETVKQSGELI